jgi:diamine N-acetyltransferase
MPADPQSDCDASNDGRGRRMKFRLEPVTLDNRGDLDDIDPGRAALEWVHSNWYWHQVSLDRPPVNFRLVHVDGVDVAVGMVGYGQAYADEALLQPVPGRYELAHLVIDHRHHRQGIGKAVARSVLTMLAAEPDCSEVIVAHHPDNEPSRLLFQKLGLQPTEERNYDGDPLLVGSPSMILGQAWSASSHGRGPTQVA